MAVAAAVAVVASMMRGPAWKPEVSAAVDGVRGVGDTKLEALGAGGGVRGVGHPELESLVSLLFISRRKIWK